MQQGNNLTINDPVRSHLRIAARISDLHTAIRSGKYPSLGRLAEITGRSERTVKRDIALLRSDLNAPLEFDNRRNGYYYTDPFWDFALNFTEGELLTFFLAERALRTLGQTNEAALLRTSLAKLAAHLPEQVSVKPSSLAGLLTFQPLPFVEVEPQVLNRLARAALNQQTLEIFYHTQQTDESRWRAIDVYLLHNFAGDWYAISFDHHRREMRDFHVGRIRQIKDTGNYFEYSPKWKPQEYLRDGFAMTRGGRKTQVSLRFDSYQARWIRERQTFHPDEAREELPDGGLRLKFPVGRNGLTAVARFVLAYAGHCIAEHPAALRRLIRQQLKDALRDHTEETPAPANPAPRSTRRGAQP